MNTTPNHKDTRRHTLAAALISLVLLSTGCAKSGQFPASSTGESNQSSEIVAPGPDTSEGGANSEPVSTPSQEPLEPNEPQEPIYKMQALAWESTKYPERTQWSQYLQRIILNEWSSLLPGADDIESFCPRYHTLDNYQRANAWAQIFVAIAKYESAYSPVSRMRETTMGTDPVTRQPVYSEGLLQLSYQDIQWAPYCKFDWQKDKDMSSTNPQKTILDPFINLHCGVGIMARQIKNKGRIVVSSGVYWAVIKSGGRYQQISSIQAIARSLPLCK